MDILSSAEEDALIEAAAAASSASPSSSSNMLLGSGGGGGVGSATRKDRRIAVVATNLDTKLKRGTRPRPLAPGKFVVVQV
jgi:hypothetical protein